MTADREVVYIPSDWVVGPSSSGDVKVVFAQSELYTFATVISKPLVETQSKAPPSAHICTPALSLPTSGEKLLAYLAVVTSQSC